MGEEDSVKFQNLKQDWPLKLFWRSRYQWLGSPTDMYLEFWMSEASGLGNQGTTEVSPVPEMGLPKDEASGQSFLSHTQTLEVGWGTKLDQRLSHYFDEPTKTLRVVNGNYEKIEI